MPRTAENTSRGVDCASTALSEETLRLADPELGLSVHVVDFTAAVLLATSLATKVTVWLPVAATPKVAVALPPLGLRLVGAPPSSV